MKMDLVEEVKKRLAESFEGGRWTVDFSDGTHMSVEIVYGGFAGKGLVEQHKMVYAALDDLISSGRLHALKLKTKQL